MERSLSVFAVVLCRYPRSSTFIITLTQRPMRYKTPYRHETDEPFDPSHISPDLTTVIQPRVALNIPCVPLVDNICVNFEAYLGIGVMKAGPRPQLSCQIV